jgi:hypothetical protein
MAGRQSMERSRPDFSRSRLVLLSFQSGNDTLPIFPLAFLFALTLLHQVWLYSIQSEVFSLNNMLCAWTLYFAVRCVSSADVAPLRFGALFVGLCSCNQHTSIFLFFPAVVWIYINRFKDVNSNIISMILCGVCGLLPYLYIPYQVCRAFAPRVLVISSEQLLFGVTLYQTRYLAVMDNWGEHRTVAGFLHHFLRKVQHKKNNN